MYKYSRFKQHSYPEQGIGKDLEVNVVFNNDVLQLLRWRSRQTGRGRGFDKKFVALFPLGDNGASF
jgi:hypothetical protein